MIHNSFNKFMLRRIFLGETLSFSYEAALLRDPRVLLGDSAAPLPSPYQPIGYFQSLELDDSINTGYARLAVPQIWDLSGSLSPVVASVPLSIVWTNQIPAPPEPNQNDPTPWHEVAYYAVFVELASETLIAWFDKVAEDPIILQRDDTLSLPSLQSTFTDGAPQIAQ